MKKITSNPFVLFLVYVASRILLIFRYPIFNDEAIYVRYGRIMTETAQQFYSLGTIGKQPLIYWIYGIVSRVFTDPFTGPRLVTVTFGAVTLWGVVALAKKMYGERASILAGYLYVAAPLLLFFDSLAIVDNALSAVFVWICYGAVMLTERIRWKVVAGIGVLIGASLWVKTTGLLFLFAVLFVLLLSLIRKRVGFGEFLSVVIVLILLPQVIILPLLMRPEIVNLFRYQQDYALTIGEILRFPLSTWLNNVTTIFLILTFYVSPVILTAAVAAWWLRRGRDTRTLFFVWATAVVLLIVTGRTLHGRYILFSAVPLCVLAAGVLNGRTYLTAAALVPMTLLSAVLIASPARFFHLSPQWGVLKGETYQYVDGWPSGYGVMEALNFADNDRNGRDAFIGVRWDSGSPEDTVLLYGSTLPRVSVGFLDMRLDEFPDIVMKNRDKLMYLITRNGQRADLDRWLTLLAQFHKPMGEESVEVYRFQP